MRQLTKAEALTKWCPMARIVSLQGSTGKEYLQTNRTGGRDVECLADGCACWMWDYAPDLKDEGTWQGHCGLINL